MKEQLKILAVSLLGLLIIQLLFLLSGGGTFNFIICIMIMIIITILTIMKIYHS